MSALFLALFFALLSLDLPLKFGGLTFYHTEIAAAAMAGWALLRAERGELRAWAFAFLPLGVWIGLHAAFGPGGAWEGIKGVLRPAEFALALALPPLLLKDAKGYASSLRALFFTGSLTCLWALAQAFSGPAGALNQGREAELIRGFQAAAAGMGHHNQLGAFLAAFLCLAAASALSRRKRGWAWAALALGLAALLASYSRGAWAGSLLAGAILLPALPKGWRLGALAAAAALLLFGFFGPSEAFRTRLAAIGSDADRAEHLKRAWGLWQGHAFWGWGTAGLDTALKSVAAGLPMAPEARQAFSSHLHDSYLQLGMEWGAPALAFWLLFLLKPLREAWRRRTSPYGVALMGAMAAYFLQASTDLLSLHARGMAIALCWGMMLAGARLEGEARA